MVSMLLTTMAGWLCRLLAILVNIVGTPVILHAIGTTRFGIMLIALSIGSWIGLGNAGFGRVVAIIMARYDHKSPAFVASAVSHITSLSAKVYAVLLVAASGLFLLLAPRINLGPDGAAYATEFAIATIAVFLAMTLWFFLAVFEGVDAGRHELFRLYWFQIISYLITLTLLFTVFRALPSLLMATLLSSSGFLLGNVMQAISVWRRRRNLFVARGRPKPLLSRAVLVHSLDFTIISMAISIIFQFTTGTVGLVVGPDAIINLGVFMRVMASVGGVILTVTVPMSNLITGKLARQDRGAAIMVAAVTSATLVAFCGAGAVAFDLFGERLFALWLRTPVVYDPAFRTMASCLIFMTAVYACSSGIAVGFGHRGHVAWIHAVMGAAVLPLCYFGFRFLDQAGILLAINAVLALGSAAFLLSRPGLPDFRVLAGIHHRLGAVAGPAGRRETERPPAV